MSQSNETGVLGNLTAEQERKLQQAWVHLQRLEGLKDPEGNEGFKKTPSRQAPLQKILANKSPETFKDQLWSYVKGEHPDGLVLRFLRARKWDVDKSMDMLVSAVNWRLQTKIDSETIKYGESVKFNETQSKHDKDFLMQYRSGKSYVRGHDNQGRPIYMIRVRLHDPRAQTSECMEAYTLHNIESMSITIKAPEDKALLFFDMTDFGLKNMDFNVVRFLVYVFEARYPETLGVILIHRAPFVFSGIWNIIKGWLDPVIASKINFTKSNKDLLKFIDADQLQTFYGGEDKWEYEYIEPEKGEDDRLTQTEERDRLQKERQELVDNFDRLTQEWIALDPESSDGKSKYAERTELAGKMRNNFWDVDPYLRARTLLHRQGVVTERGEVDFQGAGKKGSGIEKTEEQPAETAPAAETEKAAETAEPKAAAETEAAA